MSMESSLVEHFSDLPDPRMVNKCRHKLLDIVMIAICATIADADSWDEIAAFAEGKEAWLRRWLELPNGVPSADTIQRGFENLDSQAFVERFTAWVRAVFAVTAGQVVAVDGKALRGTCDAQGQSQRIGAGASQRRPQVERDCGYSRTAGPADDQGLHRHD